MGRHTPWEMGPLGLQYPEAVLKGKAPRALKRIGTPQESRTNTLVKSWNYLQPSSMLRHLQIEGRSKQFKKT